MFTQAAGSPPLLHCVRLPDFSMTFQEMKIIFACELISLLNINKSFENQLACYSSQKEADL